jgi:hypothetical protein
VRASETAGAERAPEVLQFDAAELRRFGLELARFVGPFATYLEKRAAPQASCIRKIVQTLGGEINEGVPANRALGSLTLFQ